MTSMMEQPGGRKDLLEFEDLQSVYLYANSDSSTTHDLNFLFKMTFGGTWVAQLLKRLTLDVISGYDLEVLGSVLSREFA